MDELRKDLTDRLWSYLISTEPTGATTLTEQQDLRLRAEEYVDVLMDLLTAGTV